MDVNGEVKLCENSKKIFFLGGGSGRGGGGGGSGWIGMENCSFCENSKKKNQGLEWGR